jgi:hypothetical protein
LHWSRIGQTYDSIEKLVVVTTLSSRPQLNYCTVLMNFDILRETL